MPNKNGMNWITQHKRLAIYLRDGLACAYCGAGVEAGAGLTLDHVVAREDGGNNQAHNLVTACFRCNSAKGDRGLAAFARAVAEYLDHGVTPAEIRTHVRACVKRALPMAEAKALVARRGSAAKVLAHIKQNGGNQ